MSCEYERERERRIAANRAKMAELGIDESVAAMTAMVAAPAAAPRAPRKRASTPPPAEPARRSARPRNEINYAVMVGEIDRIGVVPREAMDYTEKIKSLQLSAEEAELMRAEFEERRNAQAARGGDGKVRGPKDSGKGVRVQGGRVYDSTFGVTCHWCRQKTLEAHVTCTHPGCGANRMPYSFCHKCLKNRHGEDADAAAASGCWVCPACRGSCGLGCICCCNCGPCRKKAKLEPTAQILPLARSHGFSNVHDYLVHLVTGEDEEEIRARKAAAPWGAFLRGGIDPASDESAGTQEAAAGGSSGKSEDEEGAVVEEEDGLEGMETSGEENEEEDEQTEDGSSGEEEEEEMGAGGETQVAAMADAGVEDEAPAPQAGRNNGARRGAAAARGSKASAPTSGGAVASGKPPRPNGGRGKKSSKTPQAKRMAESGVAVEPVTAPRPVRPSPPVDASESTDQESKQSSSRKARMMARMGLTSRAGAA